MFYARPPSPRDVEAFIARSRDLPLSYAPIGIAGQDPPGYDVDEVVARLGRGDAVFERAKAALVDWAHFRLGWVELLPLKASIEPGTVVAVVVRQLGFWSLHGCRVLYHVGQQRGGTRFGFAYGTLTNHAEMGEEIFEVFTTPESGEVFYRIRAVSRPHALLARVGYPVVRRFQARFRRDSVAAMQRI
jgi:uncharacterized protein (UPF0548 family)